MKKLLGVDYGEVRTGLAHSDALGIYAVGMGKIKSYSIEKTARLVAEKAAEIGAETIVIGKPVNMNGSCGSKVELVTHFGELVGTFTDIPIEYYDERLSTLAAHQILSNSGVKAKNRKEIIDSLSAELILQNYMDFKKSQSK